jgi:hypothetical protein
MDSKAEIKILEMTLKIKVPEDEASNLLLLLKDKEFEAWLEKNLVNIFAGKFNG